MHAYVHTHAHTHLRMYHTYIHTHAYKYTPGAAEQLATLKAEGGDVPTISEGREGGVGGTRRVVAQAKTLTSHYIVTLSRKNTRVLTFEKF